MLSFDRCSVQLSGRRLQNHGGLVHTKGLIPTPMPRWLEQLCTRVHEQLPLFGDQGPNHVLINAYQPGCGIMVSPGQLSQPASIWSTTDEIDIPYTRAMLRI